jgi:hypothetical protein
MPFLKLQFRPGIVKDTTDYSNEGGFSDGDKIRFFSGFAQKLGGWIKTTPTAFLGVCRQMFNWITSFSDDLLAVGTNIKVYIEVGGVFYDITPLRETFSAFNGTGSISGTTLTISGVTTGSLAVGVEITGSGITSGTRITAFGTGTGGAGTYTVSVSQSVGSITITTTPDITNCISTTSGSTAVTFTITNHGLDTGAYVTIAGVTGDPGGIPNAEINTEHEVVRLGADDFSITVDTPASSTTSGQGGANISVACQINPGFASATLGYGWGTDVWGGDYGWGLAGPQPVVLMQRDWWFDNFDNDLVMNIRKGEIYYWERGSSVNVSTALGIRAVLLSSLPGADSVPNKAMQVLVSQNDKHLLAFGCQPLGGSATDYDPLLIRWASQDDPQVWNPTPLNSAGFLRISRGSEIIRALPTRQEILVWTNSNLYSLQYLGTTDVFALQELADNISIISPRAVATANNVTYWMGQDKFYVYTGQVQTLPCTVRDYVFKDINFSQFDQIVCGTNEGFTEIWWFYPSANSSWNNRYVIFNHLENAWYYGNLVRTAWLDTAIRGNPIAASTLNGASSGHLFEHESGVNDDTQPMQSFIQSSDFDLGDGEKFMLTERMIPDFRFTGSTADNPTLTMTIRPKRFSGTAYENQASDTQPVIEVPISQTYTGQVFIRARGRQIAFRVDSADLGVQWQLGLIRLSVREDGRR